MTTAREIVTKAMQVAGILTKSESPSADEAVDGLYLLNSMVSSWSNESMLIYARSLESFPLVGGTTTYLMGLGQTFNTTRPNLIVDAFIRDAGNTDYPMMVISEEDYDTIITKSNPGGIPYWLTNDNGYPYQTLKLYPVPTSGGYSIYIRSEKVLTTFTLDTAVELPPGWELALIYNLSMLLSPIFGQPIDQTTMQMAKDSKGSIQRAIIKSRNMDVPINAGWRANILTGWNNGRYN